MASLRLKLSLSYLAALSVEVLELIDAHYAIAVSYQDTVCLCREEQVLHVDCGGGRLHYNWLPAEGHTEDPPTRLVRLNQNNQPTNQSTRHRTSTSQLTCSKSGPRSPAVSRWRPQTPSPAFGTTWRPARLHGCTWRSTGDEGGAASTDGWCSQRSNSGRHRGWMETRQQRSQHTEDDKENLASAMAINTPHAACCGREIFFNLINNLTNIWVILFKICSTKSPVIWFLNSLVRGFHACFQCCVIFCEATQYAHIQTNAA